MKNIFYILFISCLILSSCGEENNEEKLARDTFEIFVNDDVKGFKSLYVTQRDMKTIIENSSIPADMKKDAIRSLRIKTAFWRTLSNSQFSYVRFRAFEEGVDWQNAEITDIKTYSTSFGFFRFSQDYTEKYGIHVKDIDISFVSQKDTFIMHLDNCIKTNYGWRLTEEVRIRRKSWK